MGNNFGAPHDVDQQLTIMRRALAMIHDTDQGGTLIDWHDDWPAPFEYFTGQKRAKAS